MVRKVIVFGDGKIAEEIFFYFKNDSPYEIEAFCVDGEYMTKKKFFGLPVIAFEDVVDRYPPDDFAMFVALGYQQLNSLRERKYHETQDKGYELVSYICSKASNFGDVKIGANSLVLENATLQPLSQVGDNVFIWSGNHIGHHAVIKDHVYVTGHVMVAGNAVVGNNCFLGVNSTIGHNVTLGEKCLVGAGAMVLKNAAPGSVFIEPSTEKFRFNSEQFMQMTSLE